MTIRIHLTAADLVRVTISQAEHLMLCETVLSLQDLQRRDQAVRFGPWRRHFRGRLPSHVAPLTALVPAHGPTPGFLLPPRGVPSYRAEIEAVLATPRHRLAAGIAKIAATRSLPPWTRDLAEGDRDALAFLRDALSGYYDVALAPYASGIRRRIHADRVRRIDMLASGGIDALLSRLHPTVRWTAPVLHLPSAGDEDVHFDGRGLRISPHYFGGPAPHLVRGDGDAVPVLAYPVPFDPTEPDPLYAPHTVAESQRRALADLLGKTRAAVLQTLAAKPGLTTSQLAHRLGISLASASTHAATLREAGLVTSSRHGSSVRHNVTALSSGLLHIHP